MKMSTLLQRNRIEASCNNSKQSQLIEEKKFQINIKIELHTRNSKPKMFLTTIRDCNGESGNIKVVRLFLTKCWFCLLRKCYVISS